ncbi:MAG TPA: sulfatase-like hydrolase/transferase [Verrucomicrobiota bacterium]|nr:sulfatase-like hydrolase/transferase [Verrucomicrobiota bacterium]
MPLAEPATGGAPKKPNIVIVVADDLGWADVGYHSDRIPTPHLDRIAREGVELDHFYVFPMCSPTRAGLMTGRYPIRFGMARAVIPPWRHFGLDPSEVTLPEALARVGYQHRGVFGKWHLGHNDTKWHPNSQGFTHFHGHYNGAIDYFDLTREGERDWHINEKASGELGYSTQLISDAASRFIVQHAGGDAPYFCYIPFNAPHSPFQAPKKYLKKFTHLAKRKVGGKNKNLRQKVAAMVSCMDDGIGQILRAIDDSGEADDTLVWFFSDNGGVSAITDNNLPLRGNKLDVWEGGVRVPAAVRWPGGGIRGGGKISVPLSCIDVMPTLTKLTTGESSADLGNKPFDGRDVLEVLRSKRRRLHRELFFYHGQAGEERERIAIRTAKWKLLIHGPNIGGGEWQSANHERFLFRIDRDPNETTNLLVEHPEMAEQLAAKLVAHRKLQPANSVKVFNAGRKKFKAPKDWVVR